MKIITIKELLVDRTYPEAGTELYNIMEPYIQNDEKVFLNLEGVEALPSMFLNVSIGKIIEISGLEKMKRNVSFHNISSSQIERLKIYIAHYEKQSD